MARGKNKMKKAYLATLLLLLLVLASGCVRRIVTFDSQPQGAEVYFGRKLVGETPCEHEFFYYGTHYLELAKEGYANLQTTVKLSGPFYQYFPLSFISELLIPWEITDQHSFSYKLEAGESKKPIISPIAQPQPPLPTPRLERIPERQQEL